MATNFINRFTASGNTGLLTTLYGTCGTAAATAAKTVTVDDFVLETQARVTVKFTYANSAASPTLNVNSKGAKAIYWRGAALPSTQYWAAGQVIDFVYDGTYWNMIGAAADTNTTYSAGDGLSLTNTTFSNSGVRAVTTGSTNGTISVNTNGTSTEIAVKGLGSAAYTASTAYVPTSRTINNKALTANITLSASDVSALPITGGTITGTTASTSTTTGALIVNGGVGVAGNVYAANVYGAVWNDYAEYRQSDCLEAGRVICENGDDTLSLATERLQPGAEIVSDTFGFAIGKTDKAQTPIAVSGRVLAYTYEDRNQFKPGDAVCAAPNGTVSIMTREEIRGYPERIIGTVSAIPEYKTWGEGNVPVNGRIWIKIK